MEDLLKPNSQSCEHKSLKQLLLAVLSLAYEYGGWHEEILTAQPIDKAIFRYLSDYKPQITFLVILFMPLSVIKMKNDLVNCTKARTAQISSHKSW